MDLSLIQQKFKEGILETRERNPRRTTFHINSAALIPLATHLFREQGFRFIIASALHTRRGFEIYYHFSYDPSGLILNLHVLLDAGQPEIESLTPLFEAANWIEREMHELFGINFLHHPNQEQLLSEGNWAEGVYPYRKDFHHSEAPEP
jgi:NADH:ubiquinone oxidoreductase subunit C